MQKSYLSVLWRLGRAMSYDVATWADTSSQLSDQVDLVTDENAAPSFIRVPDEATPDDRVQYMTWTQYFMVRPSFKHRLSQRMSREVTAFLRTGSLQSSAQLRTCNPGRETRTSPLVCVARVAR